MAYGTTSGEPAPAVPRDDAVATGGTATTDGRARPDEREARAQRPSRAVVEVVAPVVDSGRFPAKATVGEHVEVLADVFVEGHDHPDASLWVMPPATSENPSPAWREIAMDPLGNDRWSATFVPDALGRWQFCVSGWHARWSSWRSGTQLKLAAAQDVEIELRIGADLLGEFADTLDGADADHVSAAIAGLRSGTPERWLTDRELSAIVRRHLDRRPQAMSGPLPVLVEPPWARFSAWYEFFPRSTVVDGDTDGPPRHGTLRDAIDRLDYIADLGFDVVYLPPIHPIGRSFRKGRNNTVAAEEGDVGSPWAIGAAEGGHTAVAPELGDVDDVRQLAAACRTRGMRLALDIAFQCAPDHPWVSEHPEWFRHRPDGTIQYAENPPKKYQDIYPLDFESPAWNALWQALRDVVEFWIDVGVDVFRVDNPHTKPFAFWEWMIDDIHSRYPEVVFLAEAFSRPRVMERLAKIGFSQSYTYFTWRQSSWEIEEYFTDLATRTVDFFRPNAWPNTPDILTEQLQHGGRPAFMSRAILAATLSPSWGVYGPAFELVEHRAVREGSEEYLDSEKYQLRAWRLDQPHTLAPLLRRLNEIRRRHPSLHHLRGLRFHRCDNDALVCFTRVEPHSGADPMLVVVNLDPHHPQHGWLDIDLAAIALPYGSRYRLHDELGGEVFEWQGNSAWVRLDPAGLCAHICSVTPIVDPGDDHAPSPDSATHEEVP